MPQTRVTSPKRYSRVLYLQYTNPAAYPPVQHGARILADAGWQVLMLGTNNVGHDLRMRSHDRINVRMMRFQPAGIRQKVHYLRFSAWALWRALTWRPAWLYVSDPLACPAALLICVFLGVRVVYHEHDSPTPEAEHGAQAPLFGRLVLHARRGLARRAAFCILPNEGRAEAFRAATERSEVLVVWNCPGSTDIPSLQPRSRRPDTLRVWYHGSIVPSRVPMTVIEALSRLPQGVSLTLAGYETLGQFGYIDSLRQHASQLNVADRFEVLPAMPYRKLLVRCAEYDVGLALLPRATTDINEREMIGASNKPFDYMACGVVPLVTDLPAWRTMYVDAGYAKSCDPASVDSVAGALQWFLEHPAETIEMGERGRRQIRDAWNYEQTFAPVLRRMSGLESAGAYSACAPTRAEG